MSDTELAGPELAGTVCTRICHDLVSPVGAVVNGADLIDELGVADAKDEMAMIAQSARRAAAMLKFHRLAFGPWHERPERPKRLTTTSSSFVVSLTELRNACYASAKLKTEHRGQVQLGLLLSPWGFRPTVGGDTPASCARGPRRGLR